MIKYKRGKFTVEWFAKPASIAMSAGTFAAFNAAGAMTFATATSSQIEGILMRAITSADDDYALTTKIPVLIPTEDTVFEFSGEAHNATAAMNGEFIDITDADTINGGANSLEVIRVKEYISATELLFTIPKKSGIAVSANAD